MNDTELKDWEKLMNSVIKSSIDSIVSVLPENGVFIDVGANIGSFSERVFKQRNCKKAYLFEPIPEYQKLCAKRFNQKENIIVEQYALSDVTGSTSMWVCKKVNFGWNTLVKEIASKGMDEIIVEAITFDDYAIKHSINHIDVIKIDVEAGEYKVLKGMKQTLSSLFKKPYILCEIGCGINNHPYWKQEVEMFEWLIQNGYERFDYNVRATTDVLICPSKLGR